jgi:superfamily II DNA or RNA helicase
VRPTLRDYQLEAIEKAAGLFGEGYRRVLIVAPTGSGKTVIAAEIIRRLRERRNRALFLAAARELIFQTSNKLNDIDVSHGIIMAGVKPRLSDVQVASVQTLARRESLPPAELVVIDEADLARASTYEKILAHYPDAMILGLTATPWRSDGKGLGELFEASVVAATPRSLMDVGHLVEADGYTFQPLDLDGVKIRAGDFDEQEQGRRATQTADGKRLAGDIVREFKARAVESIVDGQPVYRRAIVFAVNIEHSELLAQQFREAGVPAEHIEGSSVDRDGILRRLRDGTTRVVTNCSVLTRGVDIPAVEVVVLARRTKSLSLFLQMIGRGLRPSPGKTRALILDHAACILHKGEVVHGLPDTERDYSLKADAKARSKKSEANDVEGPSIVQCRTCFFIAPGGAEACPRCGAVMKVARTQIELVGREAEAVAFTEVAKIAASNAAQVTHLRDDIWTGLERGWKPKAPCVRFKARFGTWPSKALCERAIDAAGLRSGEPREKALVLLGLKAAEPAGVAA